MSAHQEMPSARRRRIPGMAPSTPLTVADAEGPTSSTVTATKPRPGRTRSTQRRPPAAREAERRPAVDYAATRLLNFRLPADLHDRFKALVHEAEHIFPPV